jgi:hypothetical protein
MKLLWSVIARERNIPKLVYGYVLFGRRHVNKPRKRWTDQQHPWRRNTPGTAYAYYYYHHHHHHQRCSWLTTYSWDAAGGRNSMWPILWKLGAINTYQYPPFPAAAVSVTVSEPAVPSCPHYRGVREVAYCTRGDISSAASWALVPRTLDRTLDRVGKFHCAISLWHVVTTCVMPVYHPSVSSIYAA